jgi:hypothetical protein
MPNNKEKLKELEKFAEALAKDVASKDLDKPKSDTILVLYLSTANMSPSKVPILARSAAEGLRQAIPDARLVVVPTQSQETRLECINPRLAKPEEEQQVLDLIEKVDRDFQEFLKAVSLPKEEKSEAPQENPS